MTEAGTLPEYIPAAMRERAVVRDLARGDHLFRRGEPVEWLAFVLEGELKAVRYQPDGAESVMVRGLPGEFFAEASLATGHYVCDGIAKRASRVALWPADEVQRMLGESGEFALGFAMAIARQSRKQCSRYERLRLKRARDRVMHYLNCEVPVGVDVTLSPSLVELAAELGLEPETLYRTLAELEEEGIITRSRRTLRVLTPAADQS